MNFEVDSRIDSSAFFLGDWPLSRVYLKNVVQFPWMILVPRVPNVQEIYQLSVVDNQQLMIEIVALSQIVEEVFNPDKLNIGALGNIVSQLHLHVVARFQCDPLWPNGIWQPNVETLPYPVDSAAALILLLEKKIRAFLSDSL